MIAYFDTSAVVKLLVREPGSSLAIDVWNDAEERVTGVLTYAETRAALASARRGGRLRPQPFARAKLAFEERWSQMVRLRLEHATVRTAGDLAEDLALRGFDALHLATAVSAGAAGTLLFVTWDEDLARAARRVGLAVAPATA